jgi:hypothetical protein
METGLPILEKVSTVHMLVLLEKKLHTLMYFTPMFVKDFKLQYYFALK